MCFIDRSKLEAVLLDEDSVVAFLFFSPSDFTVLVTLHILRLLFLGAGASSSPDSTPQRTWAQPARLLQLLLFFCTLLFNVRTGTKKYCVYMEIVVVAAKAYTVCTFCFFLFPNVLEHDVLLEKWINTQTRWEEVDDIPAMKRNTATMRYRYLFVPQQREMRATKKATSVATAPATRSTRVAICQSAGRCTCRLEWSIPLHNKSLIHRGRAAQLNWIEPLRWQTQNKS